jgi:hypothetical protein
MDKGKRALLEQAAHCHKAADDMDSHLKAAKKLKQMAMEYEITRRRTGRKRASGPSCLAAEGEPS